MAEVYVNIKKPKDVRKNVLEGTKLLLESLKKFENFNRIRNDKLQTMEELKKTLADLDKLNLQFKQLLPKLNIKVLKDELKIQKSKPNIVENSTLDMLERAVLDIEKELSKV